MKQTIVLPRLISRDSLISRIATILHKLPTDKAWRLDIAEHKTPRTLSQNALLWAIYGDIIEKGGEAMAGWDKDDLHEFFLIKHYGGEIGELFGMKRIRPLARSSKLNKIAFADHCEFILRFMAEQGLYISTQREVA